MTTVLTNGCFQIIHPGHCRLLAECKRLAFGGPVIVALNTDQSIERLKPGRLLMSYEDRKRVLESISYVNVVTPFDTEEDLIHLLRITRPGYLVKGKGPCGKQKRDLLSSWGGKYISMEADESESTSAIVERIRAELPAGDLRNDR